MAMVVLGAGGGLGRAITLELREQYPDETIFALSRQPEVSVPESTDVTYCQVEDYDEKALGDWVREFKNKGEQLIGVVSTIGMLHDEETFPEKKLTDITADNLNKLFSVNAVKPMLALKAFLPILDRKKTRFWDSCQQKSAVLRTTI